MIATSAQTWLLRAALRRGDAARQAWQTWQSLAMIDTLDEDSTWLLPLLYDNLSTQSLATTAQLVRYENVYRHNWYKNHLMLHRARPAIERLQHAGASVTLLGGCAMALGYYQRPGARPFERVAVASRPLASPADGEVMCAWKGLSLATLGPEAQLVDICLQREVWDRRSGLLWMADVATIMQQHRALDWMRVADLADRAGQAEQMRQALAIVEDACGEAVSA